MIKSIDISIPKNKHHAAEIYKNNIYDKNNNIRVEENVVILLDNKKGIHIDLLK
jgi:hypothetical protein